MSGQLLLPLRENGKKITDGCNCPTCGQYVKTYHRKINKSMAIVLMLVYRSGKRDFFHIENWLKVIDRPELRADFHKLRFWNFIEKKIEDRKDGSNRNGFYKITGRGIMFCEGKITAKEKAIIYNNQFLGFEGKDITIKDVSSFDYNELMSNN